MNYPKLSDLDMTHPQVAMAVDVARKWAAEKAQGNDLSVVLSGPNGIGKTHIANAILWSMRNMPEGLDGYELPSGRFFSAANLIVELGAYADESGRIRQPPVDYFIGNAPIVVLDDVGAKILMPYIKGDMQAEEIQARWFILFEYCLHRTRIVRTDDGAEVVPYPPSLIITTNLDLTGGAESPFAKHIGIRSWDRLQVMAPKGFMVAMNNVESYRKRMSGR